MLYGSLDIRTGGYLYDRKLVENLRKLGDQVQLFSLPWRTYVQHLSDNLSHTFQRQLEHAPLEALLQDELNHPSLFLLNMRLKERIKYPIFSIVHHLRISEPRSRFLNMVYKHVEARYLESVDGFICNSQATLHSIRELVGDRAAHVITPPGRNHIPRQIQPTAIISRVRSPGPLELLFVGSIIPRKGLHTLLEALALIPEDDWRLNILGDPNRHPRYTQAMHRLVHTRKLSPRVAFQGALTDAELYKHMRSAHVLCVPSNYEGFGITYLEAMGFGLVPVGGTSGGTSELIEDGRTGFLIDPGDVVGLAERLHQLMQNKGLLERVSLEAHRRFLLHSTWEEGARRIRSFLSTQRNLHQYQS